MNDSCRQASLRYIFRLYAFLLLACAFPARATARLAQTADTAHIIALYKLTGQQTDPDSAIAAYKQLATLSLNAGFLKHIKDIYLKMGEKYANKGDFATSLEYMNMASAYATRPVDDASISSHIGWVYFSMGDYVTASTYFYKAVGYLKQVKIGYEEALQYIIIYRFLGMIHYRLHQNEKALYFLDLGEDIARENNNVYYTAIMLFSKGDFFNDIDQPDSALKYYNRSIEAAQASGNYAIEAQANIGIGKSLIESGNYNESLHYLRLPVKLNGHIDNNSMIESSYYLGEALYHLGRYQEAEDILVTTIAQAKSQKSNDNITRGYTVLTNVYKATGQYKKALDCMDSFSVAKDSLVTAQKAKDINLLDIKFRTVEKDKQIALQQGKIARKDVWILGISSAIVLLMVIATAVYLSTRHKQRMNAAYLQTLEKENKISVLQAVVLGGDNERTYIARELHDGIGGMLSAAMMRFSSLRNEHGATPAINDYHEGMKILHDIGDEIRKTAHNLMPDALLRQSLPEAVQAFCNNVQASGALQIEVQHMGNFDELTQTYKLNLYRIIQELVKNIIQHSHATRASVQLLLNDSVLIVSVEDNGIGFDAGNKKEGIGLQNIQTRASSLDGSFMLDSSPGKGTSVFVEFKRPLNG